MERDLAALEVEALPRALHLGRDAVEHRLAVALGEHEPRVPEDLQVMGEQALLHGDLGLEIVHVQRAAQQGLQHPKPGRVADRLENVGASGSRWNVLHMNFYRYERASGAESCRVGM